VWERTKHHSANKHAANNMPQTAQLNPPNPINHVKIFKGQPRRFALCQLVPYWFKKFPPDDIDQAEIYNSIMLRNKSSTA